MLCKGLGTTKLQQGSALRINEIEKMVKVKRSRASCGLSLRLKTFLKPKNGSDANTKLCVIRDLWPPTIMGGL
jgi:hypothetical protein